MSDDDPFEKLRPPPPTGPEDLCSCRNVAAVRLSCALTYNPVMCMHCNGEVPPGVLPYTSSLVDGIAHWRMTYDAVYWLWLDSGEYEDWAKSQLSDLSSPINAEGREVQADLNTLVRCYYRWFQDQSEAPYVPPTECPLCGGLFQPYPGGRWIVCEACSIVAAAGQKDRL